MSEWISINDALPKIDGNYPVTYNQFKNGLAVKRKVKSMYFRVNASSNKPRGFICDERIAVTHWMPLPEPPEV